MSEPNTTDPPPGPADTDLGELLRARGQRVTSQRLIILRLLRRRRQHATAEEVRRLILDELPGISLPTVYATLELLVELGLARKVDAGNRGALFDGRTDPHHHTVCRDCGRVDDLDGPFDPAPLVAAAHDQHFTADQADVVLYGRCAQCAAHLLTQAA